MSEAMTLRPQAVAEPAASVRKAIPAELKASSQGLPFRVADIHRKHGLLAISLEPDDRRSVPDESMEDGRPAWEDEPFGAAGIISVLPARGARVYVNPPRYPQPLLTLWEQEEMAENSSPVTSASPTAPLSGTSACLPLLSPACAPPGTPRSTSSAGRPAISGDLRAPAGPTPPGACRPLTWSVTPLTACCSRLHQRRRRSRHHRCGRRAQRAQARSPPRLLPLRLTPRPRPFPPPRAPHPSARPNSYRPAKSASGTGAFPFPPGAISDNPQAVATALRPEMPPAG